MKRGNLKYLVLTVCCGFAQTSFASFIQDNGNEGFVSIEAEHYTANHGGTTDNWSFTQSFANYSGSGAMVVGPDDGTQNSDSAVYSVESPRLDYEIQFSKTGIHYVWIRGVAPDSSSRDDSVNIGLNGEPVANAEHIREFNSDWQWSNLRKGGLIASIDVQTIGTHTLNVWMREDGFVFDKLMLTVDDSYTATGEGETESPRTTTFSGTRPPIQQTESQVVIEAEDYDLSIKRGTHSWLPFNDSDASGGQAISVVRNVGDKVEADTTYPHYLDDSARVDYNIEFSEPGIYHVWLRGYGETSRDDSVHLGLDGEAYSSLEYFRFDPDIGMPRDWQWSNKLHHSNAGVPAITINEPGVYTLNVYMREDGFKLDQLLLTQSYETPDFDNLEATARGTTLLEFVQGSDSDNLTVVEAENPSMSLRQSLHVWEEISDPTASGERAVQAVSPFPSTAKYAEDYIAKSPRLDFNVVFNTAGEYYVWARGYGETSSDDSLHIGWNGEAVPTGHYMRSGTGGWQWSNTLHPDQAVKVFVPQPGTHTLNVWMRENGFKLDKLVVTTNPEYAPMDTGPIPSRERHPGNFDGVVGIFPASPIVISTQLSLPVDIEVTNNRSSNFTYFFNNSQIFEIEVIDINGTVVSTWSRDLIFLDFTSTITLAPGETFTIGDNITLTDDVNREPLPTGDYTLRIRFTSNPSGGAPVAERAITIK